MRHLLILLFCALSTTFFAQSAKQYAYVNKYKDIAISEMERAGVPASIKLAQGLLESGAGTSNLSNRAKNHFGIKCGGDRWKGKKYFHKDDDYDENGKLKESCFRVYKNPESSFIAHSDFLRNNPRYEFLFRLNPYDYKRWAYGLKKAGYATSATYPQKLVRLIETLELHQYDQMNANDVIVDNNSESYEEAQLGVILNNDVKLVLANTDETPRQLSERVNIKLSKLLSYNEELTNANERLKRDERVYLQPKRNSFRGNKKYHYVQAGESLYDIAQLYGVKKEKLQKRNRIADGQEPNFNEKIKLRGWKVSKDDAIKTSRRVNDTPPIIAETTPRPDNRPEVTSTNDTEGNEGLPPITGGRRPVLTSDTGERGEDFYPPKPPSAPPIMPERPVSTTPSAPAPVYNPPKNTAPPAINNTYHTVSTGDTLYNISRRYGLSVKELMRLNGMENNVIRKGQELRVK